MDPVQIYGIIPYIWTGSYTYGRAQLHYYISGNGLVWQWYYDENRGKHFKELLGQDARTFIKLLESGREVYIEDILPRT
ncbi:hypothetical protein DSL64_24825 [Dyadobacter luteus]|uniref:KTSC domain-containing protein n=1 Tax=Dyadobacter luteus TaxID=2259619 RepID=A0A3D8Y457_9BACT|nr:hypothetical protein [Dyadobacter luteus]REA57042.1 hypothetical protein DSL64_24825 [Dyadobacter luteus]